MAYIGIQPAEKFTSFATQEFSTSATTSYTLDHAVANENEIALFVNNVRQQPGSGKAYTATGTALTLSAATASTDTMYCVFLGRALQTVVPATNSITAAMVGNDLISGKDALTATPADTDELLVSDAGTLKRVDYSLIKSIKQIVVQNYGTETNVSNTSYADTNITADITPASTANKVLVIASPNSDGYVNVSTYRQFFLRLLRDSTELMNKQIHIGADKNPTNDYVYGSIDGTFVYLDSPSSTSALTYKLQAKVNNTANNCNVRINGDNSAGGAESTLTLIEVSV